MGTKTVNYRTSFRSGTINDNIGTGHSYSANDASTFACTRTRTGVSNPNWRSQVKVGTNATTVMTASSTTVAGKGGVAFGYRSRGLHDPLLSPDKPLIETYQGNMAGYLMGSGAIDPSFLGVTSAKNLALKRLYQAIRSQSTHFSGGTFLGELKESLGTIRNIARKTATGIERHLLKQQRTTAKYVGSYVIAPNGSAARVKDFNPRKGKMLPSSRWTKLREELADNWLEFAFGVRPLIADIHDGAEALARFNIDNRHTVVKGFGDESTPIQNSKSNMAVGNMLTGVYTVVQVGKVMVIYRAGLKYSVDSPAFGSAARLRDLLGFKLEDFVPTVWNLLPYSFLLDYFVNVGDILNAITTDTSSVQWVNETTVKTMSKRVDTFCTKVFGPVDDQLSGGFGVLDSQITSVTRVPSSLQIPTPEVEIPGILKKDGSFNQQWVNMVALLSGGKGARRGF